MESTLKVDKEENEENLRRMAICYKLDMYLLKLYDRFGV